MRDEANTGIQIMREGRERIRSLLVQLLLPLLLLSSLSWNTAFVDESAALAAEDGAVAEESAALAAEDGAVGGAAEGVAEESVLSKGGGGTKAAKGAAKTGGRGGKQFRGPDPEAGGKPHTRIRRDSQTGNITHYETYNHPTSGQGKRFDGTGPAHGGVETPHVHPTQWHGNPKDPTKGRFVEGAARPARPDEIPNGL